MSEALETARRAGRGELVQGRDVGGPLVFDCDVVVVGSGAGGGASSYELARAGLDVVVLEEGGYTPTHEFSTDAVDMIRALYRDAGTNLIFGKPDIMFSEGRTVGGSTVINGGICWRTSDKILKRWQWEHGLPPELYSSAALEPFFERVEGMINAAPQSPESLGEDVMRIKKGCDALGYATVPVLRNQRDCMGSNNCIFGCPTGAKQSTLVSYLPAAVQHGARIYSDARIERVTTDRQGRATGVVGTVKNPLTSEKHKLVVRARAVVLSCGATQTPVLLQGSKLGNKWVGKNLLVHPNVKAIGIYDEDITGWHGTIQGFQVSEFIDEGIMMSTTFVPPPVIAMAMPYLGEELMDIMRNYNRMVMAGVLVEDSTSGTVRRGPGGAAVMRYDCTPRDISQMLRGLALLSEVLFASGAKRVLLPIDGLPELRSPDELKRLFDYQADPKEIECLTVHATGSARLADRPERGAVDPHGQVWGHEGLYVADASLFPTPIGVNPQETIMALSSQIAWGIAEKVRRARPA